MQNHSRALGKADNEIDIKQFVLVLLEWWHYFISKAKIITVAAILGGIFGFGYSILKGTTYTASLSFVLEEQRGGSSNGSMSSLASLIGVSLGGMEGAGLFSSDNIMDFIKSRRMVEKTLLSKIDRESGGELLVDRYIKINELDKDWNRNPRLINFHFEPGGAENVIQDSILSKVFKAIVENDLVIDKPNKGSSIMQLDVTSSDEQFAKVFTEVLIDNVTEFYITTRTKKSLENLLILTKQVDSIRRELNNAIGGVAHASDANPNPNAAFKALRVPSQTREVDVQANGAILNELVKQKELARLNLRNDKPLIQILDKPKYPLEKNMPNKVLLTLLGAVLAGCLCATFLFVSRLFNITIKN
ncbi:lipopolysaccharide biosynthesis protein [Olivibacter sp. XZL3]|uniref:lipopolysaccharide biosynthesis protein n=1 Tax=Olivibacter sp. XZL3 TaxID=1735116 RepID=UPI0010670172|nr:lipopolysaccharide biosynthesis protein [Olivibacter sp. XZL3]